MVDFDVEIMVGKETDNTPLSSVPPPTVVRPPFLVSALSSPLSSLFSVCFCSSSPQPTSVPPLRERQARHPHRPEPEFPAAAIIMHVLPLSGPGPRPRLVSSERRQFSENAGENTNVQIGLIVGLVVGLFLIAFGAFLYVYRGSVRFSKRHHSRGSHHGQRHRRKSASSKSSQSSKASDAAPAPPDDTPPPKPDEEAAEA